MIKRLLKYLVLMLPAAILFGLIGLVALGAWVSAILNDSSLFAGAPVIVQQFTKSVYWNTRTHWQTQGDCVQFDRDTLYRPKAGVCKFNNAEFSTTMHFDENGFRRTANTTRGRPINGRIVVVGDSHAMGWGVEDDETFASLLASEHGYATFNLGVSSYGSARELRYLGQRFELEDDDIIVIQYCDNDLDENLYFAVNGTIGPYDPHELADLIAYRPTPSKALPVAGQILRVVLHAVASKVRSYAESPKSEQAGDRAAKALVTVMQAFPFLSEHHVLVVAINAPNNYSDLENGRGILESAGLALIVPSLSTDHFLQIDDHMTVRGHRVVAAAIAHTIEARMRTAVLPKQIR